MTPGTVAALLAASLVILAFAGPWLLRRAAPALVRVPRLGIAVVVGSTLIWLITLLAIGPVLAWGLSGPALLSGPAAVTCQRCLSAANPFAAGAVTTEVPTLLLLVLPGVLTLALGTGVVAQMIRRTQRSREAARALRRGAQQCRLLGHEVTVLDAGHPLALSFPARHGGIMLSSAALKALDAEELAAVLAHERAHVRQRHHLVSALSASSTVFLRWVPLVAAAANALPHYLEIAADNQARRQVGTPALVSALAKLGGHPRPALQGQDYGQALHAAGPNRIRHLVQPVGGLAGAVPAALVLACLGGLSLASAAVHLPYASAVLAGCV